VYPDPERLFEHAEALLGNHRDETDLRRAISAAYYGVFHFTCRAFADLVLGTGKRGTPLYGAVYRGLDHKEFVGLCRQILQPKLEEKIQPLEPFDGFGVLKDFASAAISLQEWRILADYDTAPVRLASAFGAVSSGRPAVDSFLLATEEQQAAFLVLLKFKPR
jgi:hypothetical protein